MARRLTAGVALPPLQAWHVIPSRPMDERVKPAHNPLVVASSTPGNPKMNGIRIVALALIAAGTLGLAYGRFTYTKDTHDIKLGPLELSIKEKDSVDVPLWAGVGAIAAGAALLWWGGRKR